MTGMVSAANGNGFTLTMTQGLSGVAMTTHSGTHYAGMSGMGMMGQSQLISVDALLQPDGTWIASHVQSRLAAGGAMAAGIVTAISGSPVSQFTLVMHDGAGTGMMGTYLAGTTTVNVSDNTTFSIDSSGVDLANLPFTPRFDRASLTKAQRVEALSSGQMMQGGGMHGTMGGGTLTATSIYLGQQGLRGTVSGYAQTGSQGSFALTLPADSAYARLTGATTVTVYQQGSTELRGVASITNGSRVQVRGLLFRDGAVFRLVAARIHGA